jgi:hypothetical protein
VNRERYPRVRSSAPVLVAIAAVAVIAATTEASTSGVHIPVPSAINVATPRPGHAVRGTATQTQRPSTRTALADLRGNAATPDPAHDLVTVTATAPVIVSTPAVQTSAAPASALPSDTVWAPNSTTVPPPSATRPVGSHEPGTGEDQPRRPSMTVATVGPDYPATTGSGPFPSTTSTTDS